MKDIAELFGYPAQITSQDSKLFWDTKSCPFTGRSCTKKNHDNSIIYGTCTISSDEGDVIICPNRLYAEDYKVLKAVSVDVFGNKPFYTFQQYLDAKKSSCNSKMNEDGFIIALGQNSGKEINAGNQMSMDWVLVYANYNGIISYTGVEVQSIDITGNYRDNWHYYRKWKDDGRKPTGDKPSSNHGYNWANVYKRLIPQLIRKGMIYSRSTMVARGLSFVLPDIVYSRFENIIGRGNFIIPDCNASDYLTIYTYSLESYNGNSIRALELVRKVQITLSEFSERFVSGPNLPSGEVLDNAISGALGLKFLRN